MISFSIDGWKINLGEANCNTLTFKSMFFLNFKASLVAPYLQVSYGRITYKYRYVTLP